MLLVTHLIFEIFVAYFGMPEEVYRLCALRYIGFLSFGGAYAKDQKYGNFVWGYFLLGVLSIYVLNYSGLPIILFKQWTVTSLPVVFMALTYFIIIIKRNLPYNNLVAETSKASFHIFLFQMCYYGWVFPVISRKMETGMIFLIINICICIAGGGLFYKFDNRVCYFVKGWFCKNEKRIGY